MNFSHEAVKLVLLGESGVGKSTIGNAILEKDFVGPFRTSYGAESCTALPQVARNKAVVVTDTPGNPDSSPRKTRYIYDVIAQEVAKGHTAKLFVYKAGRNNPPDYARLALLWREIASAPGINVLIINDDRKFLIPPSTEEYRREIKKQFNAIVEYTGINFSLWTHFTSDSMVHELAILVEKLKKYAIPEKTTLRSFQDIKDFVMKVDDIPHQIRNNKRKRAWRTTAAVGSACASVAVGVASGFVGPEILPILAFTGAGTAKNWNKQRKLAAENRALAREYMFASDEEIQSFRELVDLVEKAEALV